MVSRNLRYATMSRIGPGLAPCQVSSSRCRRSRSASSAMFFGARSATMASKPLQNVALSTPVPGSTFSFTNWCNWASTCRRWTGIRTVMGSPSNFKKREGVAQAGADAGRLGTEFFERPLVAVHPECLVAVPGGTERVPAVAAHKQYFRSFQAHGLLAQRISGWMRLVLAHGVHTDHMVQQGLETGAAHRAGQHLGIAVGQDPGRDAPSPEVLQYRLVLGEGTQVPVFIHEPVNLGAKSDLSHCGFFDVSYLFNSVYQPGPGQFPKRPVVRAVAAGGHQPAVFDLLVAPQHAEVLAAAGEQLLGQLADAVHIEQRAVGVEQNGQRAFGARGAGRVHHPSNFRGWPTLHGPFAAAPRPVRRIDS